MTNQTTALQTISYSRDAFEVMQSQAKILLSSGFLPQAIKTPEQAIAIMMTGQELGVPAMTALRGIAVIQGTPAVSPQLMLALINRSGQLEDFRLETTKDAVVCTMKRRGRTPHTETFGFDEATKLGLVHKDNYKKQPFTMFRWRAVAACARIVFADVILGLYLEDELGVDSQISALEEIPINTNTEHAPSIQATVSPEPKEQPNKSDFQRSLTAELKAAAQKIVRDNHIEKKGQRWTIGEMDRGGELVEYNVFRDAKDNDRIVCRPCETFETNSKNNSNFQCQHILALRLHVAATSDAETSVAEHSENADSQPLAKEDVNNQEAPKPIEAVAANSQPVDFVFDGNPIAKTLADLITPKQLGLIRTLIKDTGVEADAICNELFACKIDELSKKAASALIDYLRAELEESKQSAATA